MGGPSEDHQMRIPLAVFVVMATLAVPAAAQVDQQRASGFFKEAQALCERDGGRLWGELICAPMVIGDARTQTFATSQLPPSALGLTPFRGHSV